MPVVRPLRTPLHRTGTPEERSDRGARPRSGRRGSWSGPARDGGTRAGDLSGDAAVLRSGENPSAQSSIRPYVIRVHGLGIGYLTMCHSRVAHRTRRVEWSG